MVFFLKLVFFPSVLMTPGRIFSLSKTADSCIGCTLKSKGQTQRRRKNAGAWKPRRSFLKPEATNPCTTNALAGSEIIGNYSNLGASSLCLSGSVEGPHTHKKKRAGPADKIQTQTKSSQGSVCSLEVTRPSGACWERSRFVKFSGGTRKRGCQTAGGRRTAGWGRGRVK